MDSEEYSLDMVSVRLVKDSSVISKIRITDPESAIKVMGEVFKELDREVVGVINLKTDGTPINCHIVSVGSLNTSVVEPREMLKASILSNACSMIMLHNHPSGDISPSIQDIAVTDRMAKVCKMIGIPLLDHVIVGGDNKSYFSFKEKGIVKFDDKIRAAEDIDDIEFEKVAERSETFGRKVHGRGTSGSKKR